MHDLRDSLLNPSPRGTPHCTTSEACRVDQESTRQSVARGELKEIRAAAFSNRTWIITSRYCEYMYYQLGRNISHETPDHEGLILDIVRIQGMGPLTRRVQENYGVVIARTAEGSTL
ncbi:hypothetical protein PENFLA_c043G02759 [Penicillium flavigenum]|uniref:Uncharacterized protein n=1 Tax=Penicillium flavigenum TaxID=254877 RepID=A0A1V6SJ78_9EURO|nr:hypothetical protein PENFLA_c043G02759 [Penicillium flavigenum]